MAFTAAFNIAFETPAVNISIRCGQLALLQKAADHASGKPQVFTPDEALHLIDMSEMIKTTIAEPGPAGTVHGFAL